ncbi:MAG: protein-ADP-ribose hydrolase, partial [Clostridia bacterium]|nr:protein-ADP-ribose hydrolase [Clostridia bacterium]
MNTVDRLIKILSEERREPVPVLTEEKKHNYFRALVNVRMQNPVSKDFLQIQNEYLREQLRLKGITDFAKLTPIANGIYLWQGDITTLKCDGIVNAANSQMLGCFCPNHGCIDNAIHTYAGVQLRLECADIMKSQGYEEPTGKAKITKAYNLPCKYVLHTVGPIVYGSLTKQHENQLADCYRSCLTLADKNRLQSIAFCCISTGEFRFPNDRAAQIAIQTVKEYKRQTQSNIKVI